MNYRLLISTEVVEFLERLPSKTRKSLRNAIATIGGDPISMADAADFDDTGRQLQIAIVSAISPSPIGSTTPTAT